MSLSALVASDLKINLLGGGLVLLGLVLLVATLAFWRSAVEDPEVLAPLEVMADRRFSRADVACRMSMLNKVRPNGPVEDGFTAVAQAPVPAAGGDAASGEPESNPHAVRRLRAPSRPRQIRVVDDRSSGAIDPLLNPRSPRE